MKTRKCLTDDELHEIWYRLISAHSDPDDVPYLFEEGLPCDVLYGRVFDARERLSERTGIDFEDHDLMEIIESLEEIGRVCAFELYRYAFKKQAQPCPETPPPAPEDPDETAH